MSADSRVTPVHASNDEFSERPCPFCGAAGDSRPVFSFTAAEYLDATPYYSESFRAHLDLDPQRRFSVDRCCCGFMFAPLHHAAMKHVGPTRMELGTRTIFNLLGPLTNPAGVRRQLLGVYDAELTEALAYVLRELGSERGVQD